MNDHHYTYFPATDELIRDDVLKMVMKLRKSEKRAQGTADDREQLRLYE